MKAATKRALMNHMSKKREDDERRDYRDYEPENKFRDRRRREHYDNGRYAPMDMSYMRMGDDYYPDTSRRYGGNRTARNEDEMWVDSRYALRYSSPRNNYDSPYVQPVYERDGRRRERRDDEYKPMNKIGFAIDGEMERIPNEAHNDYKTNAEYAPMNESAYRKSGRSSGHGSGNGYAPLTKQTAMEWAEQFENVDGTHGPHWTMEQVKQVMAQKGIDCNPISYWLTINMIYSDFSKVAKELGVNNLDFYVKMAKAFLDDPDGGGEGKIEKYFEYVVH